MRTNGDSGTVALISVVGILPQYQSIHSAVDELYGAHTEYILERTRPLH